MFKPFGGQHLITLGLLAAAGLLIAWCCRRWSGTGRDRLGKALAAVLIGYAITVYVQKGIAGELSWNSALPLELCHWVMFSAAISLFHRNQLLSELAYFWGTAGTLQATLTPEIYSGFPSWEFILFFWSHGGVLLAILFMIAGQRFKPRPRSISRMMAATNVYAALIGAVDALFGWNYGYLCRKPAQPSLLDYLGPWPWYLLSLEFIALASFWILDLPWRLHERRR